VTGVVEGYKGYSNLRIGIATAHWNQNITDKLLSGALGRLEELDVGDVTVVRVPGALELPLACKKLAEAGCDAVVAIGAVVKGETDHYEIVVRESARGLTLASLDTGVPITNAILAVHEYGLALERAGTGGDNKGIEATDAALSMAMALRGLEQH
jgi:6,7-dimethyl-8-ribityllumazine synthase